jgi:hypothetical protein
MAPKSHWLMSKESNPVAFKRRQQKRNETKRRVRQEQKLEVRKEESACERKSRQEEVERRLQLARIRDRRYRQKQKDKTRTEPKQKLHDNKISERDMIPVVEILTGETKTEGSGQEICRLIANGDHSGEYGLQNNGSEEEVIFLACKNNNVKGKDHQENNKVRERKKYITKIVANFTKRQHHTLGKRLQRLSKSTKNLDYPVCSKIVQHKCTTGEIMDAENSDGIMSELKYLTTYPCVTDKNGRERGQWHETRVTKRDVFGSLLRRGAFVNDNVVRYYRGLLLERELARSKVEETICEAWIYDSGFMTSMVSHETHERDKFNVNLYGYSKWVPGT